MIRSLLVRIVTSRKIAPTALRFALKAHTFLYDLCGLLAVRVNGGIHPKHRLLKYKEWFLAQISPEFVVLDVGSNTGSMAALVASKAKYVYAIEIDARLTDVAKRINAASNIEFITGDATTFDYSGYALLDCVILSNVLEHIEDRIGFLKMLCLRLPWRQPDSLLFLIRVPTIEREWLAVYKKENNVEYRLDRTHAIEHTRQELFTELDAAGLEVSRFDARFGEFYVVCHLKTKG